MSRKPPGEHYWRDVERRFREDFGRDMTPEERRWFRFSYFVEEDSQPSDSAKKESERTNRERTSSGKGFRNKP